MKAGKLPQAHSCQPEAPTPSESPLKWSSMVLVHAWRSFFWTSPAEGKAGHTCPGCGPSWPGLGCDQEGIPGGALPFPLPGPCPQEA